jgi:hypothetical protein
VPQAPLLIAVEQGRGNEDARDEFIYKNGWSPSCQVGTKPRFPRGVRHWRLKRNSVSPSLCHGENHAHESGAGFPAGHVNGRWEDSVAGGNAVAQQPCAISWFGWTPA